MLEMFWAIFLTVLVGTVGWLLMFFGIRKSMHDWEWGESVLPVPVLGPLLAIIGLALFCLVIAYWTPVG